MDLTRSSDHDADAWSLTSNARSEGRLLEIGRHSLERGRLGRAILAEPFHDEVDIGLRKREQGAPEKSAPRVRVRKDHQLGNEFREDHAFTARELASGYYRTSDWTGSTISSMR